MMMTMSALKTILKAPEPISSMRLFKLLLLIKMKKEDLNFFTHLLHHLHIKVAQNIIF